MNKEDAEEEKAKKRKKLIVTVLLGIGTIVVSFAVFAGWIIVSMLWPTISEMGFQQKAWKQEFDAGINMWDSDREQAEQRIEHALKQAEEEKVANPALFQLHRKYATHLYWAEEYAKGDRENEKAISLCKPEPDAGFADQLACAYQDIAWSSKHPQFLKDKTLPAGDKEQEKSLAICQSVIPHTPAHAYKLATLAVIYADMGENEKADKTINSAIDLVTRYPAATDAAWYVWGLAARVKAVEHKYKEAGEIFEKAQKASAGDGNHESRVFTELLDGLEFAAKPDGKTKNEFTPIPQLLESKKYKDLEAMADRLRQNKAILSNGYWLLDRYYNYLSERGKESEVAYQNRIRQLSDWRKTLPNSATARVALAQCLKNYAWFARGSGYSDSVSAKGWKLFEERLAQARKVLDEDPDIGKKCPGSFNQYEILSMAQGWTRQEHDKVIKSCHSQWPSYGSIDMLNCYYLQPRWCGTEHEWESYANQRASEVSGRAGDELYARMVWDTKDYFSNVFKESPGIEWKRVKRGFKYILEDFPHDPAATRAFLKLANDAGDKDTIKEIFANI